MTASSFVNQTAHKERQASNLIEIRITGTKAKIAANFRYFPPFIHAAVPNKKTKTTWWSWNWCRFFVFEYTSQHCRPTIVTACVGSCVPALSRSGKAHCRHPSAATTSIVKTEWTIVHDTTSITPPGHQGRRHAEELLYWPLNLRILVAFVWTTCPRLRDRKIIVKLITFSLSYTNPEN